jgi:hypothetical protein
MLTNKFAVPLVHAEPALLDPVVLPVLELPVDEVLEVRPVVPVVPPVVLVLLVVVLDDVSGSTVPPEFAIPVVPVSPVVLPEDPPPVPSAASAVLPPPQPRSQSGAVAAITLEVNRRILRGFIDLKCLL